MDRLKSVVSIGKKDNYLLYHSFIYKHPCNYATISLFKISGKK